MMIKIQNHLLFYLINKLINTYTFNSKVIVKLLLPVRNKYIAKSEVGNNVNIFVFESGGWINEELESIVPSGLIEL